MGKGEETRRRIVERGLSLASTCGLEGLTLGALADELKLSKSGLFAHFDSKEAIQLAVMQEAVSQFIQGVVAPALAKPRGLPRLRALFENQLAWLEHSRYPGGCIFMAAAVEYDDRPGPVRDQLVQSQKDWLETLARAAQIAVAEGHLRKDADPDQLALEIQSVSLGFNYAARLLRDPRAKQRAKAAFDAIVDRARKS